MSLQLIRKDVSKRGGLSGVDIYPGSWSVF